MGAAHGEAVPARMAAALNDRNALRTVADAMGSLRTKQRSAATIEIDIYATQSLSACGIDAIPRGGTCEPGSRAPVVD
jgi:hypothetical protein